MGKHINYMNGLAVTKDIAKVKRIYKTLQSVKGTIKLEFSKIKKSLKTFSMWLSGYRAEGRITFCNDKSGIAIYCTGYRDYSTLFTYLHECGADLQSINQITVIEDQCRFNIDYIDTCINRIRIANAFINWLEWQYSDSKKLIKAQTYWRFLASYTLQSLIDTNKIEYHLDPWKDLIYIQPKYNIGFMYCLYRKGNYLKFKTNNKDVLNSLNSFKLYNGKSNETCTLKAWGDTLSCDAQLTDIWWTLAVVDALIKTIVTYHFNNNDTIIDCNMPIAIPAGYSSPMVNSY